MVILSPITEALPHKLLPFNTSLPTQNDRYFADDIFKCIFLNRNVEISIWISLKFVPRGPIDNKAAMVQEVACRRTGDKPLPEPMMAWFADAYMHHSASKT